MVPSEPSLKSLQKVAFPRNGIRGDQDGRANAAGKQHDWNQLEILAIGSRIRFAVNGKEVLDWTRLLYTTHNKYVLYYCCEQP